MSIHNEVSPKGRGGEFKLWDESIALEAEEGQG